MYSDFDTAIRKLRSLSGVDTADQPSSAAYGADSLSANGPTAASNFLEDPVCGQ